MKEGKGRIVYKQYVGYGMVEEIKQENAVSEMRKARENNIPLKVLEDIAWM